MKKSIANKWIKALRSGEFKQGSQALEYKEGGDTGGMRYCCLGVLCNLALVEGVVETSGGGHYGETNEAGITPLEVMEWSGLRTSTGKLPSLTDKHFETRTLAALNDNGLSFKQIANLIEKYWAVL